MSHIQLLKLDQISNTMRSILYLLLISLIASCTNSNNVNNQVNAILDSDFKEYISRFEPQDLPYSIFYINNRKIDTSFDNYISKKENEITREFVVKYICSPNQDCWIDRDGAYHQFFYWGRLYYSTKYFLVLYYQHTDPSLYYLVTYNHSGNKISKIEFAGNDGDQFDMDGIINKDLSITVKRVDYFPAEKDGQAYLNGNVKIYKYQILENGHIDSIAIENMGNERFEF